MFKSIREYENLHIAMWLLKDSCWVMNWHVAGMLMIVPTLSVAFHITWIMRKQKAELMHNIAVCCWITANSVWMTGEFFYNDTLRPYAIVFFTIGILFIAYYYLIMLPNQHRHAKNNDVEVPQ